MRLKREREIHMLLPQTHSTEVDYSLFIRETVEMLMEKKETSPAGLRRSPPLRSAASWSLFLVSLVWRLSSGKTSGDLLYRRFLGHEDAYGRRIDANGATRAKLSGPTWPGTVAAWDPLFWSSGLRSLTSFAPKSSPSEIMTLLNL